MDTRSSASFLEHFGRVVSSPTDSGSALSQPSKSTLEPVASKSGIMEEETGSREESLPVFCVLSPSIFAIILVLAIVASLICEATVLCQIRRYRRFCSSLWPQFSEENFVG